MRSCPCTRALAVLTAMATTACIVGETEPDPVATPAASSAEYLQNANVVHNFVVGNLLTKSGSYRADLSNQAQATFEWFDVSQLAADAAMIIAGDGRYL